MPDTDFGRSLRSTFENTDQLSQTQWFWAVKIGIDKPQEICCKGQKVLDVVAKGKIVIKYAELGIDLRIYPNGVIYYNGNNIGKYHPDKLSVKRNIPAQILNQFLMEFVIGDPADCFTRIGKRTGVCCYCGIKLTHPISIEIGRGPICSENFGLPFPWEEYNKSLKKARK